MDSLLQEFDLFMDQDSQDFSTAIESLTTTDAFKTFFGDKRKEISRLKKEYKSLTTNAERKKNLNKRIAILRSLKKDISNIHEDNIRSFGVYVVKIIAIICATIGISGKMLSAFNKKAEGIQLVKSQLVFDESGNFLGPDIYVDKNAVSKKNLIDNANSASQIVVSVAAIFAMFKQLFSFLNNKVKHGEMQYNNTKKLMIKLIDESINTLQKIITQLN